MVQILIPFSELEKIAEFEQPSLTLESVLITMTLRGNKHSLTHLFGMYMHIMVEQQRATMKRERRKVPFSSDNSEKGICQQICIRIC